MDANYLPPTTTKKPRHTRRSLMIRPGYHAALKDIADTYGATQIDVFEAAVRLYIDSIVLDHKPATAQKVKGYLENPDADPAS